MSRAQFESTVRRLNRQAKSAKHEGNATRAQYCADKVARIAAALDAAPEVRLTSGRKEVHA